MSNSNSSAAIEQNGLLAEVLENYDFKLLSKTKHSEVYYYDYNNTSNCQGRLLLRTLNDGSLKLSICEVEDLEITVCEFSTIDLFEFKGFGKLHDFMKLVV